MASFKVSSTFWTAVRTIHAGSHSAARERYLVDHENETGFSFPEECTMRVSGKGETRDYVPVDGFFELA